MKLHMTEYAEFHFFARNIAIAVWFLNDRDPRYTDMVEAHDRSSKYMKWVPKDSAP